MAETKKTNPNSYPRVYKNSPTNNTQQKPRKKGHKLRNIFIALTGAGIVGGGAYLYNQNDSQNSVPAPQTPAAATQKAAIQKGFPAFNPKPMEMDSQVLKAYHDLRGHGLDTRFPAAQHGPNPLFTNIRDDLFNRMKNHLQSGEFKTVKLALQQALNEQFSIFRDDITGRGKRQHDMVTALSIPKERAFNMVHIANQIMTFKMAEQNKKWIHKTELTPQMIENTIIFFGRAETAMTKTAANHLDGYTPQQALKLMDLFGARLLEIDLLADAQNDQFHETRTESSMIGQAVDYVFAPTFDAHDRYVKTLELTKKEIKRGVNAFDAVVFATNEYATAGTSARLDNKTNSFVYRFGALSQVLAGKTTKAEQIKALDAAIDNPNIIARVNNKGDFPLGAFVFGGLALFAVGGTVNWVLKNAREYDNRIKPNSNHGNKAIRTWLDTERGLK